MGVAGTATYASGTFTVKGAGNIWGSADGFHFAYQPLPGDGAIVARVLTLQGGGTSPAAGVMIRETLTAGSTNAYAGYSTQTNTPIFFDYRTITGGSTTAQQVLSLTLPYWVKVVRSGNSFSGYRSSDGVSWVQVGTSQTVTMAQNVYIGLAVGSASNLYLSTATFDNVTVIEPFATSNE